MIPYKRRRFLGVFSPYRADIAYKVCMVIMTLINILVGFSLLGNQHQSYRERAAGAKLASIEEEIALCRRYDNIVSINRGKK